MIVLVENINEVEISYEIKKTGSIKEIIINEILWKIKKTLYGYENILVYHAWFMNLLRL